MLMLQAVSFTPQAIKPWSATEPAETGKVTKKVFFDIKQGSNDLGRITIGLYSKLNSISQRTQDPTSCDASGTLHA